MVEKEIGYRFWQEFTLQRKWKKYANIFGFFCLGYAAESFVKFYKFQGMLIERQSIVE
jgi:hypothetical protein